MPGKRPSKKAKPAEPAASPRRAARPSALPKHEVRITFVKGGHDGVDVESQRAAETTWTYLAFDGFSPYIDNRPPLVAGQPEERRYRLRYRDNDLPVGEYSDVYVVTAGA